MQKVIEAIYENGVFRVLTPVEMAEGQRVRLVVEELPSPEEMIKLATSVYDGLSDEEIEEVEAIIRDRRPFFGDRTEL